MTLVGDLLETFHVLLVVVWLGADLVVFGLSLSLLDTTLPDAVRLDRAKTAQRIDAWVLRAFLLTPPVGLVLAQLRGWPLFGTPWLALKLALLAGIFLLAVVVLTGASGTTRTLERIAGASGAERAPLEAVLRRRVLGLMPPVLAIYALLVVALHVALSKPGG